jgi:hypothetical protein
MSTHRQIVPYNTGRVLIGSAWTPRITASEAQWIEKHKRRSSGRWWWIAAMFLGGMALLGWLPGGV